MIVIDNIKAVLVNVYAPNDTNQQVVFLRGLSNNPLSNYDNGNLVYLTIIRRRRSEYW